ncbi:MAG TPA: hypothetical protein DCS07_00685 [Bdellovibrionales bacterium]|nr:MAG: hypothetical protein A2Z97_04665 [Bdellovibrionales bacterium GWB1_52_6]OFZ05548.1 MAG: hypothetical protein A2X97_11810 [Bdellovibrionales bacterium GWA1_52_35]OFZ37142.1 MAG: hypothetical protein A2070_13575 [Bdellovibrionales bacterium GWC1_52_8]HAR41147.1 hypothetical protein [Bdellovibrionales bacterium]HCM39081.1 hypothetical protein [Bdellovibrionales bacterium]
MRASYLYCLLLAGFAILSISACSSLPGIQPKIVLTEAPKNPEVPGPRYSLAQALRTGALPGLEQESQVAQEALILRAKDFSKALKNNKNHTALCKDKGLAEFCAGARKPVSVAKPVQRRSRARITRSRFTHINREMNQGQIQKLHTWTDDEMRAVIRKAGSFKYLEKFAKAVLSLPGCAGAEAAATLGGRAEEEFPEQHYRTLARSLYEKAAECGQTEQILWSGYRAGLLHLWEDRCDLALPYFVRLANASGEAIQARTDLRSRALFWAGECGRTLGAKDLTQTAGRELLNAHPFTLQALLVQRKNPDRLQAALARLDTPIQLRSLAAPELNFRIRGAEALLMTTERRAVHPLLKQLVAEVPASEPHLRLYLGYLQSRSGDYLEKFRTLSALFREDSMLISRATLELYYPRKDERLKRSQNVGLDQFVLLSLVRQESAFNERARSTAGAVGLMQVMPSTARKFERLRAGELYEPATNVRIGVKFFKGLLARYKGDTELALAAYNAGPHRVDGWTRRYPVSNRLLFLDLIPFRETRDYVSLIARNYFWYRSIYSDQEKDTLSITQAAPVFQAFESDLKLPLQSGD